MANFYSALESDVPLSPLRVQTLVLLSDKTLDIASRYFHEDDVITFLFFVRTKELSVSQATKTDILKSFADSDIVEAFHIDFSIKNKTGNIDGFRCLTLQTIGFSREKISISYSSINNSNVNSLLTSVANQINLLISEPKSEFETIHVEVTNPLKTEPTKNELFRLKSESVKGFKISLIQGIALVIVSALLGFLLNYLFF